MKCGLFAIGQAGQNLWRGSLLPLGREAAPAFLLKKQGLLRSPAGASSLATLPFTGILSAFFGPCA